MPNCFQLTRKGEQEPLYLQQVDVEICKFLNVPVDPILWVRDWYNTIGFALAMGDSWAKIRERFPKMVDIIDYMEKTYDTDAWYSAYKKQTFKGAEPQEVIKAYNGAKAPKVLLGRSYVPGNTLTPMFGDYQLLSEMSSEAVERFKQHPPDIIIRQEM